MRKIILFTAIVLIAMTTILNAQNKGTYEHLLGWTYWKPDSPNYEMGSEKNAEFSDQNILTIKSIKSKIKGFGTLMKNAKTDLYLGKTVRMTAYVKSENVKSWAGLWMRVNYYSAAVLAFDNMQKRPIKGTKDWAKYEIVLFVPAEATSISYGVLLAGTGQIWFKDVVLEVVDDTVAETGQTKGREHKAISFEKRAKAIGDEIKKITDYEKNALKTEIDSLDKEVANGMIPKGKAEVLKLKKAEVRAATIEKKVAVEESKLNKLVQDKVDGKVEVENVNKSEGARFTIGDFNDCTDEDKTIVNLTSMKVYHGQKDVENRQSKRTTTQFVYAIGVNNLVTGGAVANSDFRYWQSRFYEWGFAFNTRIDPNHNLLHFKYGLSLMYNDLKPTDNRLFVDNGSQTDLETNSVHQDDSRFRNVNLVVPLHLEFDFTKPKIKDGKTYFKSHNSFRLGIGGYLGANVKSKQILKYDIDNYYTVEKTKGDFNTNGFIYGLSTYVGYKATSLYLKYDLNPLFENNAVDQNNISLGVRFDFN